MRLIRIIVLTAVALAACSENGSTPPTGTPAASAGNPSAPPPPGASVAAGNANSAATSFAGRSGELLNPEAATMVFLYYDLAGMKVPMDTWVEDDSRVKYASGTDKQARREAVRAEFESAAAAVRNIGRVRVTMNANLSEYDPAYGEFMVRALAPSSILSFDALGQKVSLTFRNGQTAQIWKVPQAEAQAIRDKISYLGNVTLDALLNITGVQPAPGGGMIVADVVEYEMQESTRGVTVGRVQVGR